MIERHKKLIIFLTAYIIVTALAVIPFTIVTDGTGVAIVFLVSTLLMLLIINIWHGKTMKLKYLIAICFSIFSYNYHCDDYIFCNKIKAELSQVPLYFLLSNALFDLRIDST